MPFKQSFIKYWLPVFLGMALVFWMSTETFSSRNTSSVVITVLRFLLPEISSHEAGLIHAFIRKFGHVIEYFVLGLLLFRAFRGGSNESFNWRWPLSALTVVVLWAASDEFHQFFIPTRTASGVDVGIDTAGGMFAQVVGALRHLYRMK
jgi:VanZ family protein